MAFRGVTFSGQNVTPKNDGALYNAHYGDGILEGCSMAISGDDLVIQSGHIIACGRECQVDGATNVDLSGRTLQTGYIQVVLNYDTSWGEGQQWFATFVESATTTFPALTQEDINTPTGTLYQLELAVVQISGGNLTSITSSLSVSPSIVKYIDGLIKERLRTTSGGARLEFIDSNGEYTTGIYGSNENDSLWLFSKGSNGIRFAPNGLESSSNIISFLPNGQQVGGHPIIEKTVTGLSMTIDGTTRDLFSIPELAGTGQYMGVLHVCVANVSGATPLYIRADDWVDTPYMQAGTWNHWYTMPFMYKGTNGSYLIVRGDLNTGNTAKLTQWKVRAIKL